MKRPAGVKELSRLLGLHKGQVTPLKRVLRDMVRGGRLETEGKRFWIKGQGAPGAQPAARPPEALRPGASGGGAQSRPARPARNPGAQPPAPPSKDELVGTVTMHPDGFGFVRMAKEGVEDVFLPPQEARQLLDGDKVALQIVPGRGGRTMGHVQRLVDRTRQMAVGTYQEEHGSAWVDCDGLGSVRVPKTQLARKGDAVKVRLGAGAKLLGPGESLVGEVAGALGKPGDRSVEVLSIAYKKGFHEEFPPEVMDEADRFDLTVSSAEAQEPGRRDLRSTRLVTIDGADARDFDDAVFCEANASGWRLVVAVADVAQYVRPGSALDGEARRRGTSVYLPGRVLPMLPERLSNGICSLRPDEDRLCLVAEMQVSRDGATGATRLYPAVMRSAARCTYDEVHEVLAGKSVPHRDAFAPLFRELLALSQALHAMRHRRGSIDFDLPETRVELDPDGKPSHLARRERWESHKVVEECMLAANEAVARWFREQGLPTVHRHHGEPDDEKLELFRALALAHGLSVPAGELDSRQLNALLKQLEGHPEQRALNQLLLRSMMQAVYSSERSGHYGLAAPDYLHFTSPIRRYPDLLVHRLLKDHWRHGRPNPHALEARAEELEGMALSSSERERAAMVVEREVVAFYSALILEGRVGEEFTGTIAGLSDKALYVELDGLFIEGQVPAETLAADWEFVPERHRLVLGGGREIKVGMAVKVRLDQVSPLRRLILLAALEIDGKPFTARPSGAGGRDGRRRASGPQSGREGFERLRARAGRTQGSGERGGSRGGERGGAGQKKQGKANGGKPSGSGKRPGGKQGDGKQGGGKQGGGKGRGGRRR